MGLVFALFANAQTGREQTKLNLSKPESIKPPGKTEHLQQFDKYVLPALKISQAQKVQVVKIYDDFLTLVETQKSSGKPLSRDLMDQTIAAKDQKLKAVISVEQFNELKKAERSVPPFRPDLATQEKLRKANPNVARPEKKSEHK